MKYLSLFTGIGGFEKGIEQAYDNREFIQSPSSKNLRKDSPNDKSKQTGATCIGYSEIDKYAIKIYTRKCCKCSNCVYNRSICVDVLNVKKRKNYLDSTTEEQTPVVVKNVPEKTQNLDIQKTLKSTEVLLMNGKEEILKSIKKSIEKLLGKESKNFLICMEESVPVVESPKKSFLPLNIKIKTEIRIEKNTEQDICTNLLLKEKTQKDTKSFATTVTTPKLDITSVLTKLYEERPCLLNFGDITKINPSELPDFDFLCGGFPCQSFSIAGKRGGFNDTRGTLFFDIARILQAKQPARFLLENVKGLLSHDNGRTFKTIISTLTELRYDLQWQVLNSKNFGVPQNRERVFIVGHLRGTPRPKVFPFGEDGGKNNELSGHITNTLTARYEQAQTIGSYIGESELNAQKIKQIKGGSQGNRVYDPSGISTTIASQAGGLGAKTGLYMVNDPSRKKGLEEKSIAPTLRSETHGNLPSILVPEATKKGYAEAYVGDAINLSVMGSKTRRGRVSATAQTLDTGMQQHTLTKEMKIRRLTPLECARLQGFPDDWHKVDGISDTQAYKCYGNAVTVNVIQAIMEKLI